MASQSFPFARRGVSAVAISGFAAVAVAVAVAGAVASGAAAEERPGRYTMTPTDGGFVRLDTESGTVSLCAKKDGGWACELMPDSQTALRKEIDALKAENKALKDDVKSMEEVLGLPGKPGEARPGQPPSAEGDGRPGGARGKLELPTEQDVDKAFDYFEKMMKKLRERMKRLEDGEKPGQRL